MSLALLKHELEKASSELSHHNINSAKTNKKQSALKKLGTERHGLKKKMLKQKNKGLEDVKYRFKFSDEASSKKRDLTKDTLKKLAALDKIGRNVSSSKIIEHNMKKKRTLVSETTDKKKEDTSSLLLTEEEVAQIEKQYFVHSKSKRSNKDDDF